MSKLYVKVASETSQKGQGGNDFIDIDVLVGDAKNPYRIASLTVRPTEDGFGLFNEKDEEIAKVSQSTLDSAKK